MKGICHVVRFTAATATLVLGLLAPRPVAGYIHDGEPFDLLIIAPREFYAPLLGLKNHKDATGLPTDIVSLERVLDMFPDSDYDAPRKVKGAISYYRDRPIQALGIR